MNTPIKQQVLGVGISPTSYEEVCRLCQAWVEQSRAARADLVSEPARYVCVTSVHGIMTARSDAAFRRILNQADLATPDGMPVVWALRSFGCRTQQRVYGPTLMWALCEQAARQGHRIFLYGARPETLGALSRNLQTRIPGLAVAGMHAPPFRPLTAEEDTEVTRLILASEADLVFVGISTPKQEAWMSAHRATLPGVVMFGVGAAFDFHAGMLSQAPSWMQRNGLEWFYRLAVEPRRLWRRYLLQTPLFLPLWFLQLAGWKRIGAR
jgi:N-acetylglucosaminyldiphosphoundecaprenol N-acetyl-beta-D-mannosaminyltransferase